MYLDFFFDSVNNLHGQEVSSWSRNCEKLELLEVCHLLGILQSLNCTSLSMGLYMLETHKMPRNPLPSRQNLSLTQTPRAPACK